MRLILRNAQLLDLDPPTLIDEDLIIQDGIIADPETEVISTSLVVDCSGKLIVPGLVVGHTHLYSALAVGMPPPKRTPDNFVEILEEVWWKLDRSLDEDAVFMSALVGAARAALCGSTCLVDHHASPNAIKGSLDLVEKALEMVGIRGVLCYEVTDRNGPEGTKSGLEENARYLERRSAEREKTRNRENLKFAGLVGAHASFTLSDDSLSALAELADSAKVGVHIHVAEDGADVEDCRKRTGGKGLVDRLEQFRILRPGSVLGHCTHLNAEEIARVRAADAFMAHNTRSNMNNSVGYAPIAEMAQGKLALGTDGIDGDMYQEMKAAWFKSRDARVPLPFGAPAKWAAGSADLASNCLGVRTGRLQPGYAADLAILDYDQLTPITEENGAGHWFFGLQSRHVESVMVMGQWIIRNREFANPRVNEELKRAPKVAAKVWERFSKL
jgi:putative selenium metabolism protein SsnA